MIYAVVLACAYAIFMSFWVVHLHNEVKVQESRVQHRDAVIEELRAEIWEWRAQYNDLKRNRSKY
jgi:hypothetical protein